MTRHDGGAGTLSAPVLVAREAELAALVACVGSAPAIAVVEGEAGVGKTRLVAELLASPAAAGRLALVGRGQPLRDPFPLGPVVEALREPALCSVTVEHYIEVAHTHCPKPVPLSTTRDPLQGAPSRRSNLRGIDHGHADDRIPPDILGRF